MPNPYHLFFRLVFKRMDPEAAHELAFRWISRAGRVPIFRDIVQGTLAPYLGRGLGTPGSVEVLGRTFGAPFGLAGGFDKDAGAVRGLTMLGFAYIEVGTITPLAQPGNEAPRMFREIPLKGLRNRMGFNNDGADAAAETLATLRRKRGGKDLAIGVNIGKNKDTPAERAAADYATCARKLSPYADYVVVNVSSPNTPGLRDLQSVEALRPILAATLEACSPGTPVLVKVSPDLADTDIDAVADLVAELGLAGAVAVNTTLGHDLGPGGLSGVPLRARGVEVVARLRERLGAGYAIIGSGGILTVDDAQEYLDAGADLIQGYTGFIYEGPLWAGKMNRALVRRAREVLR